MPKIQRSALVPFSAQQMFQLVNDIESYPQFLPWCGGAEVLEDETLTRVAKVQISKGPIKQHFTTRNELQTDREIKLNLVDGPFKSLDGVWTFAPIGEEGCRVSFEIDFSFGSVVLEKTIGSVFNDICARMIDAFTKRAHELHK